jgi:hypothetical protein
MIARSFLVCLGAVSLLTFFFSCGECSRKIDCPGYKDDTLDSWFPYRTNQSVVFASTANVQNRFTLENTETTSPYQQRGGIYGPSLWCEAKKVFQSKEADSFKRSKAVIELLSRREGRSVRITIDGNDLDISGFSASGMGHLTSGGRIMVPRLIPQITLVNKTFHNVMEAVGDTIHSNSAGFYKVYYAKDQGLISYTEYPSLITWVKQ